MGKEASHLLVKLGGQRLVVAQDQSGLAHIGDNIGHSKRLARTRNAQQHLGGVSPHHAFRQLADSLRLVAGRLVLRSDLKIHDALLTLIECKNKENERIAKQGKRYKG